MADKLLKANVKRRNLVVFPKVVRTIGGATLLRIDSADTLFIADQSWASQEYMDIIAELLSNVAKSNPNDRSFIAKPKIEWVEGDMVPPTWGVTHSAFLHREGMDSLRGDMSALYDAVGAVRGYIAEAVVKGDASQFFCKLDDAKAYIEQRLLQEYHKHEKATEQGRS